MVLQKRQKLLETQEMQRIDLTRIATRAADKHLYLPGYVKLTNGTNFEAIPGLLLHSKQAYNRVQDIDTAGEIFVTMLLIMQAAAEITKKVIDWFMDNDYRETADFAAGSRAFARCTESCRCCL